MSRLNFKLENVASASEARAATFTTLHGEVQTPIFMPVGTQATVKGQTAQSLITAGSNVLLANTYHLLLRPGMDVFKKVGGIHKFMNWDRPVLTDSGGFQIFSLPHSRSMNEEGANFKSYVDGKNFLLSPELSIEMQKAIGSDIMMVLDQCIPSTAPHAQAKIAMDLTHRWAKRSLAARGDSLQSMFGIVQGACYHDLRKQSAEFLSELSFDGFGIGGLAVGESRNERDEFCGVAASFLPKNLPRYLMGVGTPIDILEAVHRGIDMFDCILPSQFAQRGVVFTSQGKLQLRRSVYKFSEDKLDSNCGCLTCQNYSRAYLHHLVKCDEVLGWHLLATHNITFYHQLMKEMREHILNNSFSDYYKIKKEELIRVDEENPTKPPKKTKIKSVLKLTLGDYEIQTSSKGFSSIKQCSSGEIMHSVNEPTAEAQHLYVEQSKLAELIRKTDLEEMVIWDVGLGAATNAMAAIACYENEFKKGGILRPLKILSFEIDLDPLTLASQYPVLFPHLRHRAPAQLLKEKSWKHPQALVSWELLHGDFLDFLEKAQTPDLIFYDPFSFKTDSKLWTTEVFQQVLKSCQKKSTKLFTYSSSTAVRVSLLAAGFYVGAGVGTGPKSETTVAYNCSAGDLTSPELLGENWLKRWERSEAKSPSHLSLQERIIFEEGIRNHPQFKEITLKELL